MPAPADHLIFEAIASQATHALVAELRTVSMERASLLDMDASELGGAVALFGLLHIPVGASVGGIHSTGDQAEILDLLGRTLERVSGEWEIPIDEVHDAIALFTLGFAASNTGASTP